MPLPEKKNETKKQELTTCNTEHQSKKTKKFKTPIDNEAQSIETWGEKNLSVPCWKKKYEKKIPQVAECPELVRALFFHHVSEHEWILLGEKGLPLPADKRINGVPGACLSTQIYILTHPDFTTDLLIYYTSRYKPTSASTARLVSTHVYIHVYVGTHMYMISHMYMCIYMYMYMCIRICICVYTCICRHAYVCD